MTNQAPPRPATPDERERVLGDAIAHALDEPGRWRVESQLAYEAVLVRGRKTNHVLHLALTLLTFGFWLAAFLSQRVIRDAFSSWDN